MLPFHPFADIFPLIRGEEFAGLAADIKARGLREKIVLLDGAILDGRNRYLAALNAGLLAEDDAPEDRPIFFQRFVVQVDGDPLSFVVSKNIHRRHLTTGQRAYAMAEYENFRHGGPRQPKQDANLQLEGMAAEPQETRADLADKGHVSERSIASAAIVRDQGVDDLKVAVKQGNLAISAAEKIARLPEQEQPQALAKHLPNGARSIMGSRQEPDDSLDFFPTPPFATRALVERVFPRIGVAKIGSVWEPACGEGHMAEVLREYTADVHATDIFDYGYGVGNIDFLDPGMDAYQADWIITNPPFGDLAESFVLTALKCVNVGVAMFMRLQWLESIGRCERIFQPHPPTIVAQFAERVPLHKGRYDPEGGTATAYLWIVWMPYRVGDLRTELFWIPKCRPELTRDDDAERFTTHPVVSRPRPVADDDPPFDPVTGQIVESDSDETIIPRFVQSIAHGKSHSEQGGEPG